MRTVHVCVCLFVSVPDEVSDGEASDVVMGALDTRIPDPDGVVKEDDAILGPGPLVVSGVSLMPNMLVGRSASVADIGTADPITPNYI